MLSFNLTVPQTKFCLANDRYPAFVGAWGTGKTLAGIARAIRLSTEYRGNLGMVFRKEYTDLRDSTVKDFEAYTGYKVDSSRECKLSNNSVIMFRHLEEMKGRQGGVLQNVNLGWFWIEQAEELDSDDIFFTLFGRLRRHGMPQSGFITANTNGHNWIYRLWKQKNIEGGVLFEAKTADNKDLLPESFLASLEQLKTKKPKLYSRFVENSWEDSASADSIIQPEWIQAAQGRDILVRTPIRRLVSIDVARFGDDATVFYAIENNRIFASQRWEKKSTMETVGLALRFAKLNKDIKSFAVDEIGVGAGVVDRLRELNVDIIPVNSSEREAGSVYYNRRAEVHAYAADLFQEGLVSIPYEDDELADELSWAKYKTVRSSGAFQVEPKDEIKKRHGRSPDRSDAAINGLWALQYARIAVKRDGYAGYEPKSAEHPTPAFI